MGFLAMLGIMVIPWRHPLKEVNLDHKCCWLLSYPRHKGSCCLVNSCPSKLGILTIFRALTVRDKMFMVSLPLRDCEMY